MKQRLALDYQIGEGALRPFLEGLLAGVAYASQCRSSGRVSFPPERAFGSRQTGVDGSSPAWKILSGHGTIVHSTGGLGGHFALVSFDGADNMAVCRLLGPAEAAQRVSLVPSSADRPAMIVRLSAIAEEV